MDEANKIRDKLAKIQKLVAEHKITEAVGKERTAKLNVAVTVKNTFLNATSKVADRVEKVKKSIAAHTMTEGAGKAKIKLIESGRAFTEEIERWKDRIGKKIENIKVPLNISPAIDGRVRKFRVGGSCPPTAIEFDGRTTPCILIHCQYQSHIHTQHITNRGIADMHTA